MPRCLDSSEEPNECILLRPSKHAGGSRGKCGQQGTPAPNEAWRRRMGAIISSLVFQPPVRKTYKLRDVRVRLVTDRGNTIVAKHIDLGYQLTILFSHGNAEDIGPVCLYFAKRVCPKLKVNAFLCEYTGYGRSDPEAPTEESIYADNLEDTDHGRSNPEPPHKVNAFLYEYTGYGRSDPEAPTEESIYADMRAAYDYLTKKLQLNPQDIILYGRSLGCCATIDFASRTGDKVGGIVLQSPMLSIYRIGLHFRWTLPGDKFANIDKVAKVRAPVLIIHGRDDDVIPFWHAKELLKRLPRRVVCEPLFLHARHNNIELDFSKELFRRLNIFYHRVRHRQFDDFLNHGEASPPPGSPVFCPIGPAKHVANSSYAPLPAGPPPSVLVGGAAAAPHSKPKRKSRHHRRSSRKVRHKLQSPRGSVADGSGDDDDGRPPINQLQHGVSPPPAAPLPPRPRPPATSPPRGGKHAATSSSRSGKQAAASSSPPEGSHSSASSLLSAVFSPTSSKRSKSPQSGTSSRPAAASSHTSPTANSVKTQSTSPKRANDAFSQTKSLSPLKPSSPMSSPFTSLLLAIPDPNDSASSSSSGRRSPVSTISALGGPSSRFERNVLPPDSVPMPHPRQRVPADKQQASVGIARSVNSLSLRAKRPDTMSTEETSQLGTMTTDELQRLQPGTMSTGETSQLDTMSTDDLQRFRPGTMSTGDLQRLRPGTMSSNDLQRLRPSTMSTDDLQKFRPGTSSTDESYTSRPGTMSTDKASRPGTMSTDEASRPGVTSADDVQGLRPGTMSTEAEAVRTLAACEAATASAAEEIRTSDVSNDASATKELSLAAHDGAATNKDMSLAGERPVPSNIDEGPRPRNTDTPPSDQRPVTAQVGEMSTSTSTARKIFDESRASMARSTSRSISSAPLPVRGRANSLEPPGSGVRRTSSECNSLSTGRAHSSGAGSSSGAGGGTGSVGGGFGGTGASSEGDKRHFDKPPPSLSLSSGSHADHSKRTPPHNAASAGGH